ncbi:MAG: DUF4270 family protein [Rikenellaceae bacterium]
MKKFYLNNQNKKVRENLRNVGRNLSGRILVAVVVLFSIVVGGCVDADSMFGDSFVPPNQELDTYIDSGMTVKTTLIKLDSLPTSGLGAVYVGAYHSDMFGDVKANAFSTYFPYGFFNDTIFGLNPTFDSMQVQLDFNGCVGDTTFKMEISVHQIVNFRMEEDSLYYSNFDAEPFYDPTPIVEFVLSGDGDTTVTADLPESFYSRFLYNDPDDEYNPYYNDSVFIDIFKGFYIKMNNAPTTAEEGSIRQISLSSSLMRLYYHNEVDGETDADTTTHDYYFYNSYVEAGNNFSTFEHDYSTVDVAAGGVNLDDTLSGTELSRCMIQGFCGVGSQVEFDTAYVEKIKADAAELGYGHIALHSARMQWGIESRTPDGEVDVTTLDRATDRLVMYYDIEALDVIKDYDPSYESSGYTCDIDGYINRSRNIYTQLITSTMQAIFNKPDDEYYKDNESYKYITQLLPSWDYIFFYSETVVGGSASTDNAPQIVLVYTLVK